MVFVSSRGHALIDEIKARFNNDLNMIYLSHESKDWHFHNFEAQKIDDW